MVILLKIKSLGFSDATLLDGLTAPLDFKSLFMREKLMCIKNQCYIDDVTLSFEDLKALTLLFSSLFSMASSVEVQMKP